MDRYYTVMIIPEREKGVRTFRIPRPLFRSLAFMTVVGLIVLGVLFYDYYRVLGQIYENKHLAIENRQLKEQIHLNLMKINTLTHSLQRIEIFEKKLRVITGLETQENGAEGGNEMNLPKDTDVEPTTSHHFLEKNDSKSANLDNVLKLEKIESDPEFAALKVDYEKKVAQGFGLTPQYSFIQNWSELSKRSLSLSSLYAQFDYEYKKVNQFMLGLEVKVHELDQFLLDKESLLNSTPTLLPTKGWVTSYYGPRKSPYSGTLKMHEGLDIGAKPGTDIVAPADGVISFAGNKPGFGQLVQIDHGYGIETFYGHNKAISVYAGQKISRGTTIAKVGSTGRSTGPHVHYEVRVNGVAVDPLYYVLD